MSKRVRRFVWLLVVSLSPFVCADLQAATVYGSVFASPGQLVRIDTVSGQVTSILSAGAFPDSLVFDSSGRIIYTLFGANQVRRFDPVTHVDTLVSGGFSGPLDLALEPGGATVLVSNNSTPRIDRLDITTGAVTPFLNTGGGGLTYDTSGRLYAVLPGQLAELNPQSGAVLQSTPGVLVLDGVAFDPSTGNLFATDGSGGHVLRFNRNNLAAGGQVAATLIGSGGFVDGIAADGTGQLLVAVRNIANETLSGLFQVNAVNGSFTQVAFAGFLDDIAPLAGLGAPPVVVVNARVATIPALSEAVLIALSLILMGTGLAHFKGARRRRG